MTELRRKPDVDYYKVLQVDPEAETEVIEAAYRALSKKYHPDINRSPDSMDRMYRINSAYNILSDASKRRDYNYLRNGGYTPVTPPSSSTPVPKAPPVSPNPPPAARPTPRPTNGNGKTTFNPSTMPRPEPAGPRKQASSFRPQKSYPSGDSGSTEARPKTGPTYRVVAGSSKVGWWLLGLVGLLVIIIGVVLGLELLVGNPLKTGFVRQAPVTPTLAAPRTTSTTPPVSTPQPILPASRDGIAAFLNTPDTFANRVSDVGLTAPDVVQLKVRLATGGGVLNSDSTSQAGRTADDLDGLRQAEATAYNLVYTLFGRFPDLNRINLVLLDSQNKPFYRADVPRSSAFLFYAWHAGLNATDTSEVIKAARQDRLILHFGAPLDEPTRTRLNSPTELNLQAELQSIGLSAVSVTSGTTPVISYFQTRSQAETAVDFARILYTLYTRFPTIDRLQITASSTPASPSKFIDRQLFNTIGLDNWSEASYGGPTVGGDRQAQTIVAGLPGDPANLKPLSVSGQAKYKTATQVGSWAVVAENVDRYDALSLEGQKLSAGKDRQFLVVRVALRNGADSRQWLFPGERMSLLDTRGPTVYPADPSATLLYVLKTPPSDEPPPGPLDAGKQTALYAVFNVPANVNLATFRLQFQSADLRALLELS